MTGRLRIVAGEFGGRLIGCPSSVARPTTDRVREAVFSSIVSMTGGLDGLSVCDAFAGSGALGFEALSRGTDRVQFFDADTGAIRCLKDNVTTLKVTSSVHITKRDVLAQGINGPFAPYDLVLLDPPYAMESDAVMGVLMQAEEQDLLSPGCLIVYERSADALALPDASGFVSVKEKRYGKTIVEFLRTEGGTC